LKKHLVCILPEALIVQRHLVAIWWFIAQDSREAADRLEIEIVAG
jgi:hypothetical protein